MKGLGKAGETSYSASLWVQKSETEIKRNHSKYIDGTVKFKWQFLIVNGGLAICAIIFIIVCELGVFSREVSQLWKIWSPPSLKSHLILLPMGSFPKLQFWETRLFLQWKIPALSPKLELSNQLTMKLPCNKFGINIQQHLCCSVVWFSCLPCILNSALG